MAPKPLLLPILISEFDCDFLIRFLANDDGEKYLHSAANEE